MPPKSNPSLPITLQAELIRIPGADYKQFDVMGRNGIDIDGIFHVKVRLIALWSVTLVSTSVHRKD